MSLFSYCNIFGIPLVTTLWEDFKQCAYYYTAKQSMQTHLQLDKISDMKEFYLKKNGIYDVPFFLFSTGIPW